MIDALFGSKTRVKLLHLFLNNPGKSFYVREITRLIDEQINSVRRELANMLKVGIIDSETADNKLYYAVSETYEHYEALRQIFAHDKTAHAQKVTAKSQSLSEIIREMREIRVAIAAGTLVPGSGSEVDLLLVGDIPARKTSKLIGLIEAQEGHEINYTTLAYDEFYYRLSVRDRFVTELLNNKHSVLADSEKLFGK
ncbi:transcriptional regulator [Candidatus Saccharibacteria bacterium]|nr:transcriptional regulator [Candidatus Saccharibacteria bacterium]